MSLRSSFTRRDLLSLTGALVGGVAATSSSSLGQSISSIADEAAALPVSSDGDQETIGVLYKTAEGPWGRLHYYYFYLEAPSHLIDAFPLRHPRTRWAVPLEQEPAFRAILDSAPLSPLERASLLNPDNLGVGDGIYAIFPPSEINEGMSREARGIIYHYLARFDLNPDIKYPIRIRSNSVEEWGRGTTMRPEFLRQMEAMTYHSGNLMLFADFPHLSAQAQSEEEARDLQKHSSRVRSMVVRLDVKDCASVAEIMPYWTTGLGLRRKEIEPLIQSAMDTPGITGLDLVHLLPPLPRKVVYTYPDFSMAVEGILPDCHWTALNFFNYNPEPLYLEEFFAASKLMSGFDQVKPPYRFGDVLVFVTDEMNAHHSCVYIAAEIVYTKNGRSLYAPWTILHLKDVEATYPEFEGKPLRVQGFRRQPA